MELVASDAGKVTPGEGKETRRRDDDSTANKPQLGLFAKLPEPGKVKTRLSPPLDSVESSRLFAAFLSDLGRLRDTFPNIDHTLYLASHEDTGACRDLLPDWKHAWQASGDLGQKLEAALRELHAAGGPAVILGSDHPDLPPRFVQESMQVLHDQDVVIGPTPDGGYYLVGTRIHLPELFDGVEWSSPRTAEMTRDRAQRLGLRVAEMTEWPDVDVWQDVVDLWKRLESGRSSARETHRVLRDLMTRHGS